MPVLNFDSSRDFAAFLQSLTVSEHFRIYRPAVFAYQIGITRQAVHRHCKNNPDVYLLCYRGTRFSIVVDTVNRKV